MRVGILMDPIERIQIAKDTSFALLLEAQRRGHELLYLEQSGLFLQNGRTYGRLSSLRVQDQQAAWFERGQSAVEPLDQLDILLMRKDPPFDSEYLYDTMLLELAEQRGLMVVNAPRAIRDANEKLFTSWFPDLCPATRVARDQGSLKEFVQEHRDCIIKPLDAMGGSSIFRARADDDNLNVILETVTGEGRRLTMAQEFVAQIAAGDKRILIIDGTPVPYALARIPQGREFRGNLARGGRGVGQALSESDLAICARVGPVLRERGLLFVGLDVIGDRLTEINVTSPTCLRELDKQFELNIAGQLFDCLEARRT